MTDDKYEAAGYDSMTIEFGERPALLIVDLQVAFTDPRFPLGKSPMIDAATENTGVLAAAAREAGIPIASCYTAYDSEKDMPPWKVQAVHDEFFYGHPCTEIDPRVHDKDYNFTFCKNAPSIFFQTPLTTFLHKNSVDTVIVTGCTTSGCVRASIIDAFSHGFRVYVPEDCVGDVDQRPHDDNLRDVGRRYAEISDRDDCIARIRSTRAGALARAG